MFLRHLVRSIVTSLLYHRRGNCGARKRVYVVYAQWRTKEREIVEAHRPKEVDHI